MLLPPLPLYYFFLTLLLGQLSFLRHDGKLFPRYSRSLSVYGPILPQKVGQQFLEKENCVG